MNYQLSQHCKKVQFKLSCKTLSCFHDGQHEGIILQPNINLKFIRLFYTVRPCSSTGIRTFLKPHTIFLPRFAWKAGPSTIKKKRCSLSGERIHWFLLDGRSIRKKKDISTVPKVSRFVWTWPEIHLQ